MSATAQNLVNAQTEHRSQTEQGNNHASANKAKSMPTGKPWEKGKSGNPGGRPKGLAKRVRELTGEGEDIVDFMLNVLKNDIKGTTKDRIEAAKWLADRGFGRAVETQVQVLQEGKEGASTALEDLADAQLESMARQLQESKTSAAEVKPIMSAVK